MAPAINDSVPSWPSSRALAYTPLGNLEPGVQTPQLYALQQMLWSVDNFYTSAIKIHSRQASICQKVQTTRSQAAMT